MGLSVFVFKFVCVCVCAVYFGQPMLILGYKSSDRSENATKAWLHTAWNILQFIKYNHGFKIKE